MLSDCLAIPDLAVNRVERGVAGFTHSAALVLNCEGERVNAGKIAWGGDSQRGRVYVSLAGTLCARVRDWEPMRMLLGFAFARPTRVDLAHDDFEGIRSVDIAVDLYGSNGFNSGGRNPMCAMQGDWMQVSGKGRTFYVGNKSHGKLLRVYEKGKQLGDSTSPWVRWEVEFHNRDRELPHEMVTDPARFLAGSFPALAFVSNERTRIKTQRKATQASLQHLTECMSRSYGKTINAMRIQGLDAEDILAQVIRPGIPKRLQPPMAASEPGSRLYGDDNGKP